MKDFLHIFLSDNSPKYKLLRTIFQGLIGVLAANLDVIIGTFNIPPEIKGVIVAAVMAVLTPVMAVLGGKEEVTA